MEGQPGEMIATPASGAHRLGVSHTLQQAASGAPGYGIHIFDQNRSSNDIMRINPQPNVVASLSPNINSDMLGR